MKSYTDIEQSRKLAETLPPESADGGWYGTTNPFAANTHFWLGTKYSKRARFPAWSLAALLNVLPTLDGRNAVLCKDIRYDKWHICYHSTATLSVIDTERYDNPIDACYEMIIRLHELKML